MIFSLVFRMPTSSLASPPQAVWQLVKPQRAMWGRMRDLLTCLSFQDLDPSSFDCLSGSLLPSGS